MAGWARLVSPDNKAGKSMLKENFWSTNSIDGSRLFWQSADG